MKLIHFLVGSLLLLVIPIHFLYAQNEENPEDFSFLEEFNPEEYMEQEEENTGDDTLLEDNQEEDLGWLMDLPGSEEEQGNGEEENIQAMLEEAESVAETSLEQSEFEVGWSGYIKTSLYYRVSDYSDGEPGDLANFLNQNVLSLAMNLGVSADAFGHARVNFKNYNFSDPNNFLDLGERRKVEPFEIEIDSISIEFRNILFNGLNLKVGKLRQSWGEAFLISPIDVLNPLDLSNPTDFTDKISVTMIHLEYYFTPNFNLEFNYIPLFTPMLLPTSVFNISAITKESFDPQSYIAFPGMEYQLNITDENVRITTPGFHARNLMYGVRFNGRVGGFTFNISYFYGRDYFPLLTRLNTHMIVDGMQTTININKVEFEYPRIQVAGLGLKYAIGDFHLVAEGGAFIPEEEDLRLELSAEGSFMGIPITDDSFNEFKDQIGDKSLENEVFFKAVLGADYLLGDGYIFYLVYMYGFFFERKSDVFNSLFLGRDYQSSLFIFNFQKAWDSAGIKIELGAIFDAGSFVSGMDGFGVVVTPKISYMPTGATEITLAGNYVYAGSKSFFFLFKEMDLISLSFKLLF